MVVALAAPPQKAIHQEESGRALGILREARGISQLSDSTLRGVLAVSATRQIPRGSFVFFQDEPIASVHVLLEGRVKVVRETEEGRVVIMRLIEPGELFGLIGNTGSATYRNSALAQTNARVLAIPRAVFADLTTTNAVFASAVLDALTERLGDAEARIQDLQTEHAACRIARVLLKLFGAATSRLNDAAPTLPLSRQDLADQCGTNLSTARRNLIKEMHSRRLPVRDGGSECVSWQLATSSIRSCTTATMPCGGRASTSI